MSNEDPVIRFPDKKTREDRAEERIKASLPPDEPVIRLPVMVKALSFLILCGFALEQALDYFYGGEDAFEKIYPFTFVPARYTGEAPLDVAAALAPVTHLFLHGGWMHLLVNLGMLAAFGTGVEKSLGPRKMLLLFLLCGIAGAAAQTLVVPASAAPMIGASGAISGLFGAAMMLMFLAGRLGQGNRALFAMIGVWILTSLLFGFFGAPGTDAQVAWAPHIGGFIAGLLLFKPVARLRIQH